jgi:hypothetical protein
MKPAALAAILAGLLGAATATGTAAQELGRLFFTPDPRAAPAARRKARVPDKPAAAAQVESPVSRVNGIVQRSGGKSTVWVNGEAIPEDSQAAGQGAARPAGAGRVTVPLGESTKGLDLRVGESVNRGSGEVSDIVGKDEVKVGPHPAAPKK